MDLSSFNFKKMFSKNNHAGLSLIEVLIIVAIVAILMMIALSYLPKQLQKVRDGQRKTDLNKIQKAFEHYYSDNGKYPGVTILDTCGDTDSVHPLNPYLSSVPCDPLNDSPYLYAPHDKEGLGDTDDGYRVWANLEKDDDSVIYDLSCDGADGCGAGDYFGAFPGAEDYNYGVSEGVSVLNGDPGHFLVVGECCNSAGGVCQHWNYGAGTCIDGPYPDLSDCQTYTSCN